MKKILIMILSLFTLSLNCHSFISHERVVDAFISHQQKDFSVKSTKVTEMQKTIEKNLIPIDEMFSLEIRQELDKKKIVKTSLKSTRDNDGIDLRRFDSPVKNQWNGTCTSFGLIAAMENAMGGKIHLSERYFWSLYRQYSSDIAIDTAEKLAICEEKFWPQSYERFSIQECRNNAVWGLSGPTKWLGDNVEKITAFLDTKKPVYIKMSTPTEMAACKKFISDKSGKTGGGHALSIVGYKRDSRLESGGYFILKNSWSDRCGDKGYQYLDFGFCQAKGRYCGMWGIDNVVKKNPTSVKKCLKKKRSAWWRVWEKKICIKWSN